MTQRTRPQLWPSGPEQWKAYAAKLAAEADAEREERRHPVDEEPPPTPEEEEALF